MAKAILSFGLLTDVQYANRDDGWNYERTKRRYYRSSLTSFHEALNSWITDEVSIVRFAVNLGDVLDGSNNLTAENSIAALSRLFEKAKSFLSERGPLYHCIGNHELYNFTKEAYLKTDFWKTQKQIQSNSYYDFKIAEYPYFRFIVLDSYGISILGCRNGTKEYNQANDLLRTKNPNHDKNSSLGLIGVMKRFVQYNGGLDVEQCHWLHQVLKKADECCERVFLFAHIPIHPGTTKPQCLLWNYNDVLNILEAYKCVTAVFSGHSHENGYVQDSQGVHFIVLDAILECKPDEERAFAKVHLHEDKMIVEGYGKIPHRTLKYRCIE